VSLDSPDKLPQLLMRREHLRDLPRAATPYGFELRRATPEDEESLARLLLSVFGGTWAADTVRRTLTRSPDVDSVYVVVRGDEAVATASARLDPQAFPGEGYVHWVGVSAEYRKRRLGLAVCVRVLERFAELGCEGAVLETDDYRLDAVRIYLGMGFRPAHRHSHDAERWDEVMRHIGRGEEHRKIG